MIDQRQLRRAECGDLADQFAADRTAGPRDEYPLAADKLLHRRPVEDRLWPAEQILYIDRLYLDPVGQAAPEIGQAWQARQCHAVALGEVEQPAELVGSEIALGDDDALRLADT